MRIVFHTVVLILIVGLLKDYNDQSEQSRTLTSIDSLWLQFAIAMEEENLAFLIANSLDSISCVDCETNNSESDKKKYRAEYLFMNLLSEFMHLGDLTTTKFSTFEDSTSIKVNYSIKWNKTPEGGYNLIFILERMNGNFYLAKRIFVP